MVGKVGIEIVQYIAFEHPNFILKVVSFDQFGDFFL